MVKERKEGNFYLTKPSENFTVIWRWTYGKGPLSDKALDLGATGGPIELAFITSIDLTKAICTMLSEGWCL